MKIGLAQINPVVGDLPGNGHKIIQFTRNAHRQGAELVIFPELCITGYPPMDLLENRFFVEAALKTLEHIAREIPAGVGVIVGCPTFNPEPVGKRLFNAAFLLENGSIVAEVRKTLLPTYDIFDEYRYFEPAHTRKPVLWRGLRLGIHICEDMWNNEEQAPYHLYREDPVAELAAQGVDLFINISASPFSQGKHKLRNSVIQTICKRHHVPFILVNTVGANTEIIFDGDSRVHAGDGTRLLCAPSFEESLMIWNMDRPTGPCTMHHEPIPDIHEALVLGIRDYFSKTGTFSRAIIGLSGGIDSAVTAALATEALGAHRVIGVSMPSKFSSTHSIEDARQLAENLGITFYEVPIQPMVDSFLQGLQPYFEGTPFGIAEENIQARVRGVILMAFSNKFNYLVLSTGNKSELSVGYATLYGDMSGGLAVLSDVYKTQVYELATYINTRAGYPLIPQRILEKPPSAELRPGQTDQDTLPPYPVLDRILKLYIEEHLEWNEIVEQTGYDEKLVEDILNRVDRNEYKRRQAPPGLRVSAKAFGIGRRMPIVMRWDRRTVRTILENGFAVLKR